MRHADTDTGMIGRRRHTQQSEGRREHRVGRHEGPDGLKAPVGIDDHEKALLVEKRGRHERTPALFLSSFSDSDSYVVQAQGGWFVTSNRPVSGPSLQDGS